MSVQTLEEVKAYCLQHNGPFDGIEEIKFGTGNFVYRIFRHGKRNLVIKHAEPFVKVNPNIPFPTDRMDVEAKFISYFEYNFPKSDLIHFPSLHHYDAESHTLWMYDAGSYNLKEAYPGIDVDVEQYGKRLGAWLAMLHRLGAHVPESIGDNPTGKHIYRHAYENLATALAENGLDPSLGEMVNEKYGSLLQTDNETICMGDFWPGNVIIGPDYLTIVDWEMVRRGCGATDVGQFAAEAFLLDRFRGNRGLLPAFLTAYAEAGRPDLPFIKRIAVHFGTHIAYWPTRVPWASPEATKELVELGAEIISKADLVNYGWLQGTMLGPLFQEGTVSSKRERLRDSFPGVKRSKRQRDGDTVDASDTMDVDG